MVQGHQEITARFLSAADLVLFVFPVTNPWGAATWNFLSDLPENIRQRVAFIIQQADQRDPVDIEVILGHMADLSLKRIGQVPPIFPVSGKLALEAKRATPLGDRQMKASGFPALESFISKTVCESPERKQTLRAWRSQAASALRMVENRIEFQTDTLTRHGRFLDDIEREIDGIREGFVVRLPTHLTGVAETFESEAVWVTKRLAGSLSPVPTFIRLITGDRTGSATEAIFIERLQGAVEVVAESDALELGNVCRSHWLELTVKVRESIGVELGSQDSLDESLAMARSRFVSRLGREARRGIGNLKVRNQLDKDLRRRNLALKSFAFMTLILITIGASSGALEIPWLPLVFSLAALVFLVSGLATAVMTEQRISADFQTRLLDTCGSFAATLRND